MQQIERYGVLALLLLVVTLLTVGLWGGDPAEDDVHAGAPDTAEERELDARRAADERRQRERALAREEARRRSEPLADRERQQDPRLQRGAARGASGTTDLPLNNRSGEREALRTLDRTQEDAWAQQRRRSDEERLAAQREAEQRAARRDAERPGPRELDLPVGGEAGGLERQDTRRGTTTRNLDVPTDSRAGEPLAGRRGIDPDPAPATGNRGGTREVVVRPGDALSRLVERELGSWARNREAVLALNPGLDPDRVQAGQTLLLPAEGSAAPAGSPAIAATTGPRARTASRSERATNHAPAPVAGTRAYTLRKGESLSAVAERELGSYYRNRARILELNPGLDPDNVQAGQTILLPSGPTVASDAEPARDTRTARARTAAQPAREPRRSGGAGFLSSGNYSSGGVD